jgi:adenylyl-sulfate kinase
MTKMPGPLSKPRYYWLTGLSGSGKSTIGSMFSRYLTKHGISCYVLDGDILRKGLCRDLGFSEEDRIENVRRVAEVSKMLLDAGLVVIVSLISPNSTQRLFARNLFEETEFLEIYVDCPIDVCEKRDPKGLYKSARAGKLMNFTGIDSPYEPPREPEIHLKTDIQTPDETVDFFLEELNLKLK